MREQPLVSVVTTSYNASAFIADTLANVLGQRGVRLEHVMVDDGSADRTAEIVSEFTDPRVRLIRAGRVGRGRALNIALECCRGDFVAIQDADDLSHPLRLATQLDVLVTRPDFAAVGTGQILFAGREPAEWQPVPDRLRVVDVGRSLVYHNPLSHSSMLVRREPLRSVGGYNGTRPGLFDWDLYIRLAARGYRLGKLSVPLVAKRIHRGQFFEGRLPLDYALQCFRLQWHAVQVLGRSRWLAAVFPLLLVYRLLPKSARMAARRWATDARVAST